MPKKFFLQKTPLEIGLKNRSELLPSFADLISLVALAFSALPSTSPAFSANGQHGSFQFLEFS